MTAPGYNDWKRHDFASGDIIVNKTQVFADGFNAYQGPCHQWSNIIVHWKPNGVDCYGIRVIFWTDTTYTTFYNQQYVNGAKNAEYSVRVPVQAAACWIQLVRTGTGTFLNPVTLVAFGTHASGTNYELNRGESSPLVSANDTFAINQTINYTPFWVVPGAGWLQVIPAGATGVNVALTVLTSFFNLTQTYMQWWGATRAAPVNQMVPIMGGDLTLIVANGGTSQSIQVFLTPMPY